MLQDRFDHGKQVGELATERFPGGVQIEVDGSAINKAVAGAGAAVVVLVGIGRIVQA